MSKYTTTIHELEVNKFDFGLDKYAIFDEKYRDILNNAILGYYRFREIGFQNPILWKERLNYRLDLLMRNKYNKLYISKMIEFNPLYNIDITETYTRNLTNENTNENKGTTTSNSEDKANGISTNSSFPSEQMLESEIISNMYADSAGKSNTTTTSTNNDESLTTDSGTGKTDEYYTKHTLGSSAGLPFSKAMIQLKQFSEQYDLDKQVIDELSDLFINIW